MKNSSYILDNCKLFIYEMALRSAIFAATSRNSPYKGATDKHSVRDFWMQQLCEIACEVKLYGLALDRDYIIYKVICLWKNLVRKFPHHGFGISHAQKSLSVFLKYLWCYGEIEEPPICPIDSLIIQVAARQDKELKSIRWTQMKDEKVYCQVINALVKFLEASKFSLARWELDYFNADTKAQKTDQIGGRGRKYL